MVSQLSSETLRHQLVDLLQARGIIRAPAVARAFLTVPRELFIDHFYEREGRGWERREPTEAGASWLNLIYQDDALTTMVNQYHLPISSSSQPSIMASMLEALAVQPGQRVLEIGTGTGYNAALLATLTQDPTQVTTIEVDAEIAERAASTLHAQIGPVTIQVGDGRAGATAQGPYDRIIATASSSLLPRVWYEQLAPGGRLVMPLEGSLQVSGFLVVEKHEDTGSGTFRATVLSFMAMHAASEEMRPSALLPPDFPRQPVTATVQVEPRDPVLSALGERAFKWYLQWAWPAEGTLRINPMRSPEGKEALRIADISSSPTLLHLNKQEDGSWSGNLRGEVPLWTEIQRLYRCYQALGNPGQEAFQVSVQGQHARLEVVSGDHIICVRDIFGQ